MKVEITIRADDGSVKAKVIGDAFQPLQLKTNPERPISQKDGNKLFELFCVTYQPAVRRTLVNP